jgi:formylglycine-generating enzyme required for sulfatase activity
MRNLKRKTLCRFSRKSVTMLNHIEKKTQRGISGTRMESQLYKNGIGIEFLVISDGSFMMGSPERDGEADFAEKPQHRVTIGKPFCLGRYPVTQAQWATVMGNNPSAFKGRNNPVENVSWRDAQVFIRNLKAIEKEDGYRLPTEAEWEYAVRAETSSAYFFCENAAQLELHAWYTANSGGTTHPVGEKRPNAWGLHDMYGNVWEWVEDWYGAYRSGPDENPPGTGDLRVIRGGSWFCDSWFCRSAYRDRYAPDRQSSGIGFRLAFTLI